MDRPSLNLGRGSDSSLFQYLPKRLPNEQGSSSVRKPFAKDNLEIIDEIGSGAYGVVLRASYLGDIVAVKKLHSFNANRDAASSQSRRLAEELAREAHILEQKRSRHIVNLLHYCPSKSMLVMEYCKNGSLARVVSDQSKRHVVLKWKNRFKWTWQISQAMHVMHNKPPLVLHRDLKPENILLTEHYNIRVADVGLSKQPIVDFDLRGSDSMTMHCMIWQAPEVMRERRYSTKSDVYSFGVIMHQLLMIDGPYGLNVLPGHLNTCVIAYVTSGKGLSVPEQRNLIPGKWHPCLEKYIDLMNKCCAPEPEDRPEFDEICKTLAEIQEEYKNAMMVEPPQKRISGESLKRAFIVSALVILCLLSASELLEHSTPAWSAEASAFNDTVLLMKLVFTLCGLLCIIGSALCVTWQHRKQTYLFTRECVFKPMKSLFRNIHEWFEKQNLQQEDQDLPVKSPFEVGPSFLGPDGLASDSSVAPLPIPNSERWKEIREAFISELQENADTGLQTILRFCEEYENEELEQPEWEDFVRLLNRESQVTSTDAWRRYQKHLTIPAFHTHGVLSVHESERPLDTEYPNAWGTGRASNKEVSLNTSALQGKEPSSQQLARSASFPFDQDGEPKAKQLTDSWMLPVSFSLDVPAARNEASEIQFEAKSQ